MKQVLEAIRRGLGLGSDDAEFAGELTDMPRGDVGSAEDYQLGPDDGVRIDPMPITADAELVIAYSGLLAKSGASHVFLHCGEGPGQWQNVQDLPMEAGPNNEWSARVQAGNGGTLEFCFHDGNGNWDNNSGANWSITVHSGEFPH